MKSEHQHSDLVEAEIREGSGRLTTSCRTWLEVADAMSKDVATISSDKTVVSTAKVMADKNISCIIVEDNGAITGIITETDLLKRAVVEAKDFQSTKISEIMSSPVESVSSNLSVLDASEIMDTKSIKRLPVLAEEHLVGIVTQTDLIRVLTSYGMWRDVSMIMSRDALGIQKEATVTEAAKVMAARNASSVVIMDDNEVVGIFTERDLFKRVIAQKNHPDRTRVGEVMSSPIVSITPDTSVFSASRIMEKMYVRKLVVMEDKQLYGVLSQTDIFMSVKQKLHEEEEKNHRLLELSKSNIYTLLLDGKITYVNPSFMDLLGISDPMELVGEDFLPGRFWVNPEDGENFLRELQNEKVQTKELKLKDSKGRRVYVTFFSSFTRDFHGKTTGIQGVLQDITAKKELVALREAERALQISKQQLKVSNKQLKSTVEELSIANRELKDFAHIAAHDLKAPLRGIGTLAEWIATDYADKFDEEGKKRLELLVQRTQKMYDQITGVLQFSEIGRGAHEKEEIDLNKLIEEIIKSIDPPENIQITIADKLPTLVCAEIYLTQIFQNLLSNAINYEDKPEGQVTIGCVAKDDFWKFSVADNGPGIEEEYLDKIFQIFQTLPTEGEHGGTGTGIGLAIVRKAVERYGGKIWVESSLGHGTTFFFTFPKHEMEVACGEKLKANIVG